MAKVAIEPKFNDGDYIINRTGGDIGIVKGVNKKGYYTFSKFMGGMFKQLKDCDSFTLQVNYQKFYDYCTDEERKVIDQKV